MGHKIDGLVVQRIRVDEVAQVSMLDHHALGRSGGAGGVDAVGERVDRNIDVGIFGVGVLVKLADRQRLISLAAEQVISVL